MEATTNKVLLKSYRTYAKSTGEELWTYTVIDRDDTETLRSYYDDEVGEDVEGDFESFLNGETIYWSIYDEWDSPTGGYMYLTTAEEETERLLKEFQAEISRLNKAFNIKEEQ